MLFYAGAISALLALLSLYRLASKGDVSSFLLSIPGYFFVGSILTLLLSVLWAIRILRRSSQLECRGVMMALGMNILTLVLTAGSLEALVRARSTDTPVGTKFAGLLLYPQIWSDVIHRHREVVERMTRERTFLVYDPDLGWTVAPNGRNATGMDASSAEGLRSPQVGLSFADPKTRHSGPAERPALVRLALVGDSMTFGDEVRCEESWGHYLEQALGPNVQVLNFGVSGYGLNQVLLRYQKDARPWKPQIVVIGITSEEIRRIVSVYTFLMNPEWRGMPFARPRLVIKNGTPLPMNVPVPTPAEVFAHTTIKELPSLDQDAYYRRLEWERDGLWNLLEKSYFFRLLIALRPPIERSREGPTDEAMMALSGHVLKALVREVRENGAVPLVVHFPYQAELRNVAANGNKYIPPSVQMLRRAGIDYYDATACLLEARASDLYMPALHYSPTANTVIAKCLGQILQEEVRRRKL